MKNNFRRCAMMAIMVLLPFVLNGSISYTPELNFSWNKMQFSDQHLLISSVTSDDFFSQPTKGEQEKKDIQEFSLASITVEPNLYSTPTFALKPLVTHKTVFMNYMLTEEDKKLIKEVRKTLPSNAGKSEEDLNKDVFEDCQFPNPLLGGVVHCLAGGNFGLVAVMRNKETGLPDTAIYAVRGDTAFTTKKMTNEVLTNLEVKKQEAKNKEKNKNEDEVKQPLITDQERADSTNASGELFDGNGKPTSGIISVLAPQDVIFAALAPHEGNGVFGGDGSALALVVSNPYKSSLEPVDVYSGCIGKNVPYLFNTHPEKGIAYGTRAHLGNSVAFHWDNQLQRLFVGLDVAREDASQRGGGISLFVGHLKPYSEEQKKYNEDIEQENKERQKKNEPLKTVKKFYRLALRPLYRPSTAEHNAIVSFNRDGDSTPLHSIIYGIKTMHTSTGKSYVIINGGPTTTQAYNRLYALPLKAHETPKKLGAKNDSLEQPSECDLSYDDINENDDAYKVGGGPLPSVEGCPLSTVLIVNDAIYVALNGGTPASKGLFKSYPIFKSDGTIAGWTPWHRVFGICDGVTSAFFNAMDFQCIYSANEYSEIMTKNILSIKMPQWQKPTGLFEILQKEFSEGEGTTIKNMYSFGCDTPSFKQGAFSMLVAHSYNKIALLETGNNSKGEFLPLASDDSRSVEIASGGKAADGGLHCRGMIVSGGVLDDLKFIETLSISRASQGKKGYLFVGGFNGCVVLSDSSGNGWDCSEGLSQGFTGITSDFSFKKLAGFNDVRKIETDENNVYIVTAQAVHRIALQPKNFSETGVSSFRSEVIAQARDLLGRTGVLSDCVVLKDVIVLGTSNGLFYKAKNDLNSEIDYMCWIPILERERPLHSIVTLSPTSIKNSQGEESSIITVLEVVVNRNTSYAHRLCVNGTRCELLQEPNNNRAFIAFGTREIFFNSYGDIGFYQPAKKFNDKSNLNFSPLIQNISSSPLRGLKLNIDNIYDPNFEIYATVQESASGKFLVAGAQGLRVFE